MGSQHFAATCLVKQTGYAAGVPEFSAPSDVKLWGDDANPSQFAVVRDALAEWLPNVPRKRRNVAAKHLVTAVDNAIARGKEDWTEINRAVTEVRRATGVRKVMPPKSAAGSKTEATKLTAERTTATKAPAGKRLAKTAAKKAGAKKAGAKKTGAKKTKATKSTPKRWRKVRG